jgi:hypothetical protein
MLTVTASRPTLDAALDDLLEALARGRGGGCLVCGGRTAAVRDRDGGVTHICGECGSSLEDLPRRRAAA